MARRHQHDHHVDLGPTAGGEPPGALYNAKDVFIGYTCIANDLDQVIAAHERNDFARAESCWSAQ